MSNYKFFCNHCGKSFQLETPEAKECPFCFWASSVKREDEAAAEKKQPAASLEKKAASSTSQNSSARLLAGIKFLLKSVLFLSLLAGVCFLGYLLYSKWVAKGKKDGPVLSINVKDAGNSETGPASPAAMLARLLPEEKAALYREVTLPEKIEPSVAEKQVLDRTTEIKTGWVEKLPSPVWSLEQFKQMIAEQERFYKMPFARSYKKKLEELFNTKYLPAGDAFAKGDLLAARNFWVESLAIPLYSDDLRKHRAVALTMLKPFINDTLAKIGSLNQSSVTKEKRVKEGEVGVAYQNLLGLTSQQKWAEAIQAVDQMGPLLDQLNAAAKQPAVPPSYAPAIGMVDQDIQRTLADLLVPNPVSVADLLFLKQDLAEKRDVLMGLTGEQVKAGAEAYRNALTMIRDGKWQDALNTLGSIQGPAALRDDAQAKIAILQKITGQGLDSSGKTG